MFYTYILKSEKDNGYYFGCCENLESRLHRHNHGKVRSTKSRTPFIMYYFEKFTTRAEAYNREQYFKSFPGRIWLKQNNII